MDPERIERIWQEGDRRRALELARANSDEEPLMLAEALLRCARDISAPEWEEAARLATSLREQVWPPGHLRAGYAAMPLASLLREAGRPDEAERVLRRCEALAEDGARGGDSDAWRDAVFTRARLHLARGRDDEAEAALLKALTIEERGRHPARPPFTSPATELHALYERQGRHAEAKLIADREAAMLAAYRP
jgi:ATP/maltotriose-dependent transcriptional regulator MalT